MKMRVFVSLSLFMFSTLTTASDLCDEIALDPLGRGYSSMTAEQVAADLNTVYRSRFLQTVAGADLFEGLEASDWVAISEADRTLTMQILSLGNIDPQGNARTLLISIFGSGSQTISNMASIATETVSRANELSLGRVRTGNVQECSK